MTDTQQEERQFEEPIYKHYFKTRDFGGLMSITPWDDASKFKVDIGATDTNDKLVTATAAYVEFVGLGAYLRAVVHNTAQHTYVERDKQRKVLSVATLVQYGGTTIDGQAISRVLKITPADGTFAPDVDFYWKCGHFEARKLANGAFVPDMSKQLQENHIKITRRAMGEISYKIDNYILRKELSHE